MSIPRTCFPSSFRSSLRAVCTCSRRLRRSVAGMWVRMATCARWLGLHSSSASDTSWQVRSQARLLLGSTVVISALVACCS